SAIRQIEVAVSDRTGAFETGSSCPAARALNRTATIALKTATDFRSAMVALRWSPAGERSSRVTWGAVPNFAAGSGGNLAMVELRSKARGRTAAWGAGAPTWVRPDSLGGFAGGAARHLAAWALADVGPGRLVPWLAGSVGFGPVLLFADRHAPGAVCA